MIDPALGIAAPFVAAREGFRAAPYRDQGGRFTYGHGFTTDAAGRPVSAATPPISEACSLLRLRAMLGVVLAGVRGMVRVPISDHAAAALASFAYNLGGTALRDSSLLRMLNDGDRAIDVARQFGGWVYAAGRYNLGLANRRALEAALFLTPDINQPADPLKVADAPSTDADPGTADRLMDAELAQLNPAAGRSETSQ